VDTEQGARRTIRRSGKTTGVTTHLAYRRPGLPGRRSSGPRLYRRRSAEALRECGGTGDLIEKTQPDVAVKDLLRT